MIIKNTGGKWYFDGLLYKDLSGKEKAFVDEMLAEVRIDKIAIQRTPNNDLKRHNYQFPNQ